MTIKVQITKKHNRAEDCRTIHHFREDQIINVTEKLADEIISEGCGILFVEKQIVHEPVIEMDSSVLEEEQEEIPQEIVKTTEEEKGEEIIEEAKPEFEAIKIEEIEKPSEIVEEKPIIKESKFTNKFNPFKKGK